jgi:Kef-type K+ transport system membrane component KefB
MNTRGLMEMVVLNIGLEIGVISRGLFTMIVIMALVTTAMTAPLLDRILPRTREAVAPDGAIDAVA